MATNNETTGTGDRYFKIESIVWWFSLANPEGRAVYVRDGREEMSYVSVKNLVDSGIDEVDAANARLHLGTFWPPNWPQGEGTAEPTAAPATGQTVAGVLGSVPSPATGQGHTPEPWYRSTKRKDRGRATVFGGKNRVVIDDQDYEGLAMSDEDIDRAIVTVNACAGMADPAATIRELREAVMAQREALETIAAMRCTDHANCRVFGASVESIATAAIARAREEGV